MKNGGKNKSVALIYIYTEQNYKRNTLVFAPILVYIYIYIYIYIY